MGFYDFMCQVIQVIQSDLCIPDRWRSLNLTLERVIRVTFSASQKGHKELPGVCFFLNIQVLQDLNKICDQRIEQSKVVVFLLEKMLVESTSKHHLSPSSSFEFLCEPLDGEYGTQNKHQMKACFIEKKVSMSFFVF